MQTKENIKKILKKAKAEAFFMDMFPNEKVEIEISEQEDTACWSFIPPHRIIIGGEKYNSKRSENYIKALLFHELSHSLWTERDITKINEELSMRAVPFKLYNLFEDARIEHLYREKTGKRFGWVQDIPNSNPVTPTEIFYSFVNNEGVSDVEQAEELEIRLLYVGRHFPVLSINNTGEYKIEEINAAIANSGVKFTEGAVYFRNRSAAKSKKLEDSGVKSTVAKRHGEVKYTTPDGTIHHLASYITDDPERSYVKQVVKISSNSSAVTHKVAEYYKRACNAASSFEIIELCAEWVKEFPDSAKEMAAKNIGVGNDILSPENITQIQGENIDGNESQDDDLIKNLTLGSREGLGRLIDDVEDIFDETKLGKLTQLFKGIIKRGMVKYNSTVPSKRLNIRNYSLGSDKIFKKQQYDNGRSEKLSVILDCSGSMDGEHIYAGKEFLLIINRLAKQGLIRGNIILTESSQQIALPMPADETILKSITTGGGEGFKSCIEKYGHLLQESGKVFIFTDGAIGDVPDANYNRKLGIKTYGLYVGERDQTELLKRYFDEAISKKSLEDVINELLKKVK